MRTTRIYGAEAVLALVTKVEEKDIKANIRFNWDNNHRQEIRDCYDAYLDEAEQVYLNLTNENAMVLCKRCHYYRHKKKMVICKTCRKGYHKPKNSMCSLASINRSHWRSARCVESTFMTQNTWFVGNVRKRLHQSRKSNLQTASCLD